MSHKKLNPDIAAALSIADEIVAKNMLIKEKVAQYQFNAESGLSSPELHLSIKDDMRSVDALLLALGRRPIYAGAMHLFDEIEPR